MPHRPAFACPAAANFLSFIKYRLSRQKQPLALSHCIRRLSTYCRRLGKLHFKVNMSIEYVRCVNLREPATVNIMRRKINLPKSDRLYGPAAAGRPGSFHTRMFKPSPLAIVLILATAVAGCAEDGLPQRNAESAQSRPNILLRRACGSVASGTHWPPRA